MTAVMALIFLTVAFGRAEEPAAATPLVRRCAPACVDLTGYSPNVKGYYDIGVGSGAIIHEKGYILTVNHVARDELGGPPNVAHMQNGDTHRYRIVQRLGDDLAIIKIDVAAPLPAMKMGRSNRLQKGAPVTIIGNPHGKRHSVLEGLISELDCRGEGVFMPGMIRTSAPVVGGASGAPLISAGGEIIGIVQSAMIKGGADGYALQIDHLRDLCAKKMSLPRWRGLWTGLVVSPYEVPVVTEVIGGSPADKAGLRVGDILSEAGGMRIDDGVHFYLAMHDRKEGDSFPVTVSRGGSKISSRLTIEKVPARPPESDRPLAKGLKYQRYMGQWERLPDFAKLKPSLSGVTDAIPGTAAPVATPFGFQFTGYLKVPVSGVYVFYTSSDDGSRLHVGDKLVVDNDGVHQTLEKDGEIALQAGTHPIKVEYFDAGGGGKSLKVHYEGPGISRRELPAGSLFSESQEIERPN